MKQHYTESSWAIFAGLRFILAFIVCVSHLYWFVPAHFELIGLLAFGSKAAVLGFLLISGISVGYSYLQNANGYFQRRFLRIYPLYFFAVVFACVLTIAIGSPYALPGLTLVAPGWKTGVANMFFLQGLLSITVTFNAPLWSLGVEVFFYLLVPLLVKVRLGVLLSVIGLSMLTFFYPKPWVFGYTALCYSWPWLIGFLLATRRRPRLIAALLIIGIFITWANKNVTGEVLSWFTFGFVATWVMVLHNYAIQLSWRLRRMLNFLGEISYPLYLFHFPILIFLFRYLPVHNTWLFLLLTFAFTAVLNYTLDYGLKKIFWKPVVQWLTHHYRARKLVLGH